MANKGTAKFAISGVPLVGNTLRAAMSAADPEGHGPISFRWQSSSNGLSWAPVGNNSATYRITAADQGKRLRLLVRYTDRRGFAETVTTTAVRVQGQLAVISLSLSSAAEIAEDGVGSLLYTFTRTGDTTAPLTVKYRVGGTATLGTDYTGPAGPPTLRTLTFQAGSATATVAIDPTPDARVEGKESVSITLAPGAGYTIGTASPLTGTIRDSPTIQGRLSSGVESIRYPVDVVTGSILRASLTSPQPSLFPLLELKSADGRLIKGSIAFNGNSADLGMVDMVTGQAMLHVRSQSRASGAYSLNVTIESRADIKNEVFTLTNAERRRAGLPPLVRNTLLETAAQAHADDMDASNRYLIHTGSNGSTPVERIRAAGYRPAWVDRGNGVFRTISSENAASGQTSAAAVVNAWMNSPWHKATILDPAAKDIGIGFDVDKETGATYWLQNFGHPWQPGMKEWL